VAAKTALDELEGKWGTAGVSLATMTDNYKGKMGFNDLEVRFMSPLPICPSG